MGVTRLAVHRSWKSSGMKKALSRCCFSVLRLVHESMLGGD